MSNSYRTGTASVVAGSTAVTFTGMLTSTFLPGDLFCRPGIAVPIEAVTGYTSVTLEIPWPGATATDASYWVLYTSPQRTDAGYVSNRVRELLARVGLIEANVPYWRVQTLGANTPPPAPTTGDSYVVGTAPTGAWAGQAKNIATWTGSAWMFTPSEGGWHVYSVAADALYSFVGGGWGLTNGVASVVGQTGVVSAAHIKNAIASTFFQTLMPAVDAAAALTALGFSAFMQGLRGAADATAFLTSGLGFSAFMSGIRTAVDAAAARTAIGAQASLGYTPVNRAGDSAMSGAFTSNSGAFIANNTTNVSGTITGGTFRSDTSSGGTQFAQFLCQNQVGVAIRAALLAVNGATVGSLTINQAGNCVISGSLSKASGTFGIDHPLDPYNKDLAHGFVEAPEYQNRYRGLVRLVDGCATVDIDAVAGMTTGTFAALNADAWVAGLQNQEGFARLRPTPLSGATFEIICEDAACTDLVAWEVTARRNDAYVRSGLDPNTDAEGRFICERDKPE